jgi:hypothetical protein
MRLRFLDERAADSPQAKTEQVVSEH